MMFAVSLVGKVVSAMRAVARVPVDVLLAASDAPVVAVTHPVVSAGVVTAAAVEAPVVTSAVVDVVPSDNAFITGLGDEPCVVAILPALPAWSKPQLLPPPAQQVTL